MEALIVLRLRPVGRPGIEARRDAATLAPPVEGKDAPDTVLGVAEGPLPDDEGPGRGGRLETTPRVDGVHVSEEPVRPGVASRAVDRGVGGKVEPSPLPAPAGYEAVAPDRERPRSEEHTSELQSLR